MCMMPARFLVGRRVEDQDFTLLTVSLLGFEGDNVIMVFKGNSVTQGHAC